MAKAGIVIEPLSKRHDRSTFSSGEPALDDWFRDRAGQDEKRNVARVFVAIDANGTVAGFYSLGSFGVAISDLPEIIARKLPRYDLIPAALIGRLARDLRFRGKGVGEFLLADAVRRILAAAPSLAVFAIVVEAKNKEAVAFYESFGFMRFVSRPRRLYLPALSAAAALAKAEK